MNNRRVLNDKDLISLSKILSKAYNLIDKKLINKFSKHFNINDASSKIIIRRNLVPLTYFFFENLLLLSRYNLKKKNYTKNINFKYNFSQIEDFEGNIRKEKFNRYFFNFIIESFYPSQQRKNQKYKEYMFINYKLKTNDNYKNNLFSLNHNFLSKLFLRLEKFFFRFFPFLSRIPTLHLSQLQNVFFKYGWYIFFLKNLNYNWTYKKISINKKQRSFFFSKILPDSFYVNFLSNSKIKNINYKFLSQVFDCFIMNSFPLSFFENFKANLNFANKKIINSKYKIILSSGDHDTNSVFYNCAAKNNDFKIVKIQHGGYEGYIDKIPTYYEMDYITADYFLSWGWDKIVNNHNKIKTKILPMPSPWLTERKEYFTKAIFNKTIKKYDILLMPNKIREYNIAPSGTNNVNTSTNIYALQNFIKLVELLKKENLTTYCKFYNEKNYNFFTQNLNKKLKYFPNIHFSKNYDKGLTVNLISQCKLVLWDVPGTGFLECLASRIPTLCFIDKKIIQIHKSAYVIFTKLKKSGIVNYNLNDLIKNADIFIKDDKKWISNKKRVSTVKKFTHQFARTDDNWKKIWIHKIKNIAQRYER